MTDADIAPVPGGNLMKLSRASRSALTGLTHLGGEKMDAPGRPAPSAAGGCLTPGAGPSARDSNQDAVTEESARSKHEADTSLPERRRKDIFLALVAAQDGGASVAESRKLVAQRCRVSEKHVRGIEEEGVEKNWALR